jgi:hypothetical protein
MPNEALPIAVLPILIFAVSHYFNIQYFFTVVNTLCRNVCMHLRRVYDGFSKGRVQTWGFLIHNLLYSKIATVHVELISSTS